MTPACSKEDGFSLIEALVALSIIAVAGLSLTHVSVEALRNAALLEQRMLAGIVAHNALTEAIIAPIPPRSGVSGQTALADRSWRWTVSVSRDVPTLARITIIVRPSSVSDGAVPEITLTGWRREGAR